MARAATTSDVFNAIAEPQRREILVLLRAGPYQLEVRYNGDLEGGSAMELEIVSLRGPAPSRYDATVLAGAMSNGAPAPVRLRADVTHPGGAIGEVTFAARFARAVE